MYKVKKTFCGLSVGAEVFPTDKANADKLIGKGLIEEVVEETTEENPEQEVKKVKTKGRGKK